MRAGLIGHTVGRSLNIPIRGALLVILIGLLIAIPANQMEKLLQGLQGLSKRGVRYPIPYAGAQLDVVTKLPPLYLDIYGIEQKSLFVPWNKRESASKKKRTDHA